MKINSFVWILLLFCLTGCDTIISYTPNNQYHYSCKVYNFSNKKGQIFSSSNVCEGGIRLNGMLFPYNMRSTLGYDNKPDDQVYVKWGYSESDDVIEAAIPINPPREFVAYDAFALIFCFENEKVWMAYSYYYGSPDSKEKSVYGKRIFREYKTVLENGTPFDPEEYLKYKQSNESGTVEDFLTKSKEREIDDDMK